MADVFIFGAGGLGRMVRDILCQAGQHRPRAFLDNNPNKHGTVIDGLPVVGDLRALNELRPKGVSGAVVAIGCNEERCEIAESIAAHGIQLVSAIHPLVSVSPTARLDSHLIIGPRVSICVHARIGRHCVLSAGTIIEHDNVIGRGVFLHPAVRLAGTVVVDDFATIGIGACVIPGRRIGRGARVEPGAVVIQNVEPDTQVTGVPAAERRANESRFIPEAEYAPLAELV
jgi:sugar O-acyltransferase (sialic acid O-acetyltransferase NeuD family)